LSNIKSSSSIEFNKDNIDNYLKEFAKEYRKQYGKYNHIDVILVGGASIVANYSFREMTKDIDAFCSENYAMKEIAHSVSNKFNLSYNWLNADFMNTVSYTPNLYKYAKPYKPSQM